MFFIRPSVWLMSGYLSNDVLLWESDDILLLMSHDTTYVCYQTFSIADVRLLLK